jgi:hypothetical protein
MSQVEALVKVSSSGQNQASTETNVKQEQQWISCLWERHQRKKYQVKIKHQDEKCCADIKHQSSWS